jgi:hypothetical protein
MAGRAEEYATTGRELLLKARGALAEGDFLQASEKGWGAAAHMVKGVAERKGWRHRRHRQVYEIASRLAAQSGDQDINTLFSIASALHSNYYENWMPEQMVKSNLMQVEELLHKLEAIR